MTPAELLVDALSRTAEGVDEVLDGLSDEELVHRPGPDANSIAWLIWHIARVQDDHVAHVSGLEQVYTAQRFGDRFDLREFNDAVLETGSVPLQALEAHIDAWIARKKG